MTSATTIRARQGFVSKTLGSPIVWKVGGTIFYGSALVLDGVMIMASIELGGIIGVCCAVIYVGMGLLFVWAIANVWGL